jgi:asparagine synthase (glutamine-hydrolysing)
MAEVGDAPEVLARLLRASIATMEGLPGVSIPFSGGLDSSVVAFLAAQRTNVRLLVASVRGGHDLANAEEAANLLALPLEVVDLTPALVRALLPLLLRHVRPPSPLIVSFELPLLAVLERATSKQLVTGQGADELFGGYARYRRLRPDDLAAALEADVEAVLREGAPREKALASSLGKELFLPYLDGAIVAFARALDPREKVQGDVGKVVLRKAALHLGLPPLLARRLKKAAQYGSGAASILRSLAREAGTSQEDYLARFLPAQA